jgi:CHAT domain-containing protein/tetratricopeptide (TPR) repeat protein
MTFLVPLAAKAGNHDDALRYLALGTDAYRMGDIVEATREWSKSIKFCRLDNDQDLEIEARGRRSEALETLGHLDAAIDDLEAALKTARDLNDQSRVAALTGALGNAYFQAHRLTESEPLLVKSLELARAASAHEIEAASANNLGNLLASQQRDTEAVAAYGEAIGVGLLGTFQATALTNRARVELRLNHVPQARSDLDIAFQQLALLPDGPDQALALVAVGRVAMTAPADDGIAQKLAYVALNAAYAVGERLRDHRRQSLAQGYLGEMYERAGRGADALNLTDRAIFHAQQDGAGSDILYRWQWQRGRLLRDAGDRSGAIVAYRAAAAALDEVRTDIPVDYSNGVSSFRETIGPLFLELADLLLQQGRATPDPVDRRALLVGAQEAVETMKTAEVKDFFHDECLGVARTREEFITKLDAGTAALYPIVLPDRIELLLSLPDDIVAVTVPVGRERLTEEVGFLRALMELRRGDDYLPYARQVYDWIVRPIEDRLQAAHIDTIVFIPDGPLRTIPLGALNDGKHFLIERYAVATAPGLSLVQPKGDEPISEQRALVAGLTVKVGSFPALPQVGGELTAVSVAMHGDVIKDDAFSVGEIQRRLEQVPYTIVHIASHGVFRSDGSGSYIVAYDGNLSIDALSRDVKVTSLREQPLELLTLSACETAVGDDRAALGLAGIAVKAGAETAVASLWLINDAAAGAIMPAFYHDLGIAGITKAKAMQKAQVAMLRGGRFTHPSDWAAFLVIGNWR